jgi:F0F1-type ATP synthase membrane subunit b/b'
LWGGFVELINELKELAPLTGVLVVIWGIFSYVILKPLNSAIESLHEAVKELRQEIRLGEERRHEMELKLADVEARARSAHHRIDGLEGR